MIVVYYIYKKNIYIFTSRKNNSLLIFVTLSRWSFYCIIIFSHFLQVLAELENLKIRVSILLRSNDLICILC